MRTPRRAATIAVALSFALAACGDGADGDVAPETDPSAAEPEDEDQDEVDDAVDDDGVVETDEPLEEDTFELEPADEEPLEPAEPEVAEAEEFPELPDAPFDLASSIIPGVPFPTDARSMGRSLDPVDTDVGVPGCSYTQEFETAEGARDIAEWYTEVMVHHGFEVERELEEVVGTDWGDPDSPEYPGYYSEGVDWHEAGGGASGLSFQVTVFDVEADDIRSVYLQTQQVGACDD